MFDRDGYMAFVGEKSRNSYASGLNRIENLYAADIDEQYQRDCCRALLEQIEEDKKRTDLSRQELKSRSDMASHLRRYIAFKAGIIPGSRLHAAGCPGFSERKNPYGYRKIQN